MTNLRMISWKRYEIIIKFSACITTTSVAPARWDTCMIHSITFLSHEQCMYCHGEISRDQSIDHNCDVTMWPSSSNRSTKRITKWVIFFLQSVKKVMCKFLVCLHYLTTEIQYHDNHDDVIISYISFLLNYQHCYYHHQHPLHVPTLSSLEVWFLTRICYCYYIYGGNSKCVWIDKSDKNIVTNWSHMYSRIKLAEKFASPTV